MIPINSICLLISGLFFLVVTLKIYLSYEKSREEKIGNFYKSVLFLSFTQILSSTPGLIFNDLNVIGFIFLVYPFFVFLALAHFGTIPLQILRWKKTEKIYFNAMIMFGLSITVLNALKLTPAVAHFSGPFVYWQDSRGVVMNALIGLMLSVTMLTIVAFYFFQGFKSNEKYIRRRAFVMAAGLLNLVIGSVINFIVGGSPNIYITSLISTLFFMLSGILLLTSAYYKTN